MEWVDYYNQEPWGERMADMRGGQLCSLIANCNRDTSVKPEPFSPMDFMFLVEPEREQELSDQDVDLEISRIFGV